MMLEKLFQELLMEASKLLFVCIFSFIFQNFYNLDNCEYLLINNS